MWKQYVTEPMRGRTPLWRVIWIQGFGVSLLYALLGAAFVPRGRTAAAAYLLVGLLIGAVQSVMLWQCAYNGRSRATGTLLRTAVLLGALLMPLAAYLWWRHPELADLAP
ncbi:MAG: hypothetical protein JSR36_09380 [Proteobacteria bacterium]|nr:hypothetical protein [Pseudomonadota bacterium]